MCVNHSLSFLFPFFYTFLFLFLHILFLLYYLYSPFCIIYVFLDVSPFVSDFLDDFVFEDVEELYCHVESQGCEDRRRAQEDFDVVQPCHEGDQDGHEVLLEVSDIHNQISFWPSSALKVNLSGFSFALRFCRFLWIFQLALFLFLSAKSRKIRKGAIKQKNEITIMGGAFGRN